MRRWAFTKPIDPCKSDICLVRATCKFPRELPWSRGDQCEIYKKFREHEDRYTQFRYDLEELYVSVIFILIIVIPIGLWGLGLWKLYELTWPYIKGLWA
jgi:hypothetical protein